MKIIFQPRTYNIYENYHETGKGFEFCLLDKDFVGLHPYLKCKDFFNDYFAALAMKKPFDAYGLRYTEEDMVVFEKELSGPTIALGLRYRDEKKQFHEFSASQAKKMQTFLNRIEKLIGFSYTKIHVDEENNLLVLFSSDWTACSLFVSLFFLFLRSSMLYESGAPLSFIKKYPTLIATPDASHITGSMEYIEQFFKGNVVNYKLYSEFGTPKDAHGWGVLGTVGFFRNKTPKNESIKQVLENTREDTRKLREKLNAERSATVGAQQPV